MSAWANPCLASQFSGSTEVLVEMARTWVSKEAKQPKSSISIPQLDRSAIVEPCETELQFRFPFPGNKRTVEVSCEKPSWKRFLAVSIRPTDKHSAVDIDVITSNLESWLSEQTSTPAHRIVIPALVNIINQRSCSGQVRFRFPYMGNNRTVELSCLSSDWKVFIPVTIEEKVEAVHTARDLKAGHRLTVDDLSLDAVKKPETGIFARIDKVIGSTLVKALPAGSAIRSDDILIPTQIFITRRSYEAGEVITRADIDREIANRAPLVGALTSWPSGAIIASKYLEPGQTLLNSDIEQSEYVVVSATNIIRGQVITQDMVEQTLRPKKQMGAQTLSTLDEAIGLEATRTIRAGAPITISDLTAADLVRKGEKVKLTVTRGALTISVDTIAMEDGKMGEQVELTNAESGKVIRGIVTGRHQAKGISP